MEILAGTGISLQFFQFTVLTSAKTWFCSLAYEIMEDISMKSHVRVSVEILGLTVSQRVYFTPFSFLCFVTQADRCCSPLMFSFCCKFLSLFMKNLQKSYESKSGYEYNCTTLACISQLS